MGNGNETNKKVTCLEEVIASQLQYVCKINGKILCTYTSHELDAGMNDGFLKKMEGKSVDVIPRFSHE